MKQGLLTVICAASMPIASAQTPPSVQEITKHIARAVNSYARAVSCAGAAVEPRHIAALVPYKSPDDRMNARYAVLWSGDIGCAGGSGTSGTHISIVSVGSGDTFVVEPLKSSPVIQFESPVRYIDRLVGNTADSLILEGKEQGPNDPNCCPSMAVRFTLRVDNDGHWRLVEKRAAPRN